MLFFARKPLCSSRWKILRWIAYVRNGKVRKCVEIVFFFWAITVSFGRNAILAIFDGVATMHFLFAVWRSTNIRWFFFKKLSEGRVQFAKEIGATSLWHRKPLTIILFRFF